MATRTKKERRAQKRLQLQNAQRTAPQRKPTRGRSAWALAAAIVLLALSVTVATVYAVTRGGEPSSEGGQVTAALPDTPDYHSLLVAPAEATARSSA